MSTRRGTASAIEGLGGRLSQVLAARRLSQSALARLLNASTGFVSDLTRGQKAPGAEFLVALHEALGVNVGWLLTGQGNMFGAEIDPDELPNLVLQLQLARIATADGRPEAVAALKTLHPDLSIPDPQPPPSAKDVEVFLQDLVKQNEVLATAISIFNDALMRVPREERKTATAKALEAFVQSRRAPSILSALVDWNPKPIAPGRKLGDVIEHPEWGPIHRKPRKPRSPKKTTGRSG